jgi:hypothetical protein
MSEVDSVRYVTEVGDANKLSPAMHMDKVRFGLMVNDNPRQSLK